ncbi:DUF2218 domain-containing protein [Paracoccus sp. Z330]|uniref:DUF2218 domain-containing protein n=1 Tax=Paracoccus onchidii TaxID=3017813 RepID=A0ABT4ZJ20_9RHOB|nr:DUF2218 domain-containing protein [Paracoccus onchidii]MDB6178725.1 DUF2218 domain-containing protein [Paracoccus onchidii]
MPTSRATIPTARARTYLQQLCKHFGHKVPVEFTPEDGQITLPFGVCALRADDSALTLTNTADADSISRMDAVIGDHLARFAFREDITMTWNTTD